MLAAVLVLEMGKKVNVGDGLQRQFVTVEVFQVTRVDVSLHETGQFPLGLLRRMAFRQNDVVIEQRGEPDPRRPVPFELVVCRSQGNQEVGVEVGVFRDVLHDAGNGQQHVSVVGDDRFAHGIFIAEVLPGGVFADDHRVRRCQSVIRIAISPGEK